MGDVIKCVFGSVMMGISCKLFFETFAFGRKWRHKWMEQIPVLVCAAGFMAIAFSEIPPYIFQPLRVIAVVFFTAQLCFQIKVVKNLILSVVFCGIYWILVMLLVSVIYAFPVFDLQKMQNIVESVTGCLFLCVMLLLHSRFRDRAREITKGRKKVILAFCPVFSMIVIMAISMISWGGTAADSYARLAAIFGFALINCCVCWYVYDMLKKEDELENLRLIHGRTQNQMDTYLNMQKNYEQQRRQMHDYKNQLNCIAGMVESGQAEETIAYISKLTGSLNKSTDRVNTHHLAVDVVLNQKYQEAYEKDILMTMAVNDLSTLTMSEEEIVVLLVNLLDNAIEACDKLDGNKVIQFKMMLENEQLILSIRNPVKEKVNIKKNRADSTKEDAFLHGIGLMNVDHVVKKNRGTSVVRCEDGWFYVSVMIPLEK